MPLERFSEKQFRAGALVIVEQANAIVGQYAKMGFSFTPRQVDRQRRRLTWDYLAQTPGFGLYDGLDKSHG